MKQPSGRRIGCIVTGGIGVAMIVGAAHADVTFPVTFNTAADVLTPQERSLLVSHAQAAGHYWMAALGITAPRSLEVVIEIADVPRATGSSVTSAFVGSFGGRDTFEQGAASELRTGEDPNGVEPDIRIQFGLDYLRQELWFDPAPLSRTATVPDNRTDAMSVMLHEFGHALAYNGWADGQGVPPATYWSTFDRWMIAAAPTVFAGPQAVTAWGSQPELTTQNIHHWGNSSFAVTGLGVPAPHDPVIWRKGVPLPQAGCLGLPSVDAPPSRSQEPKNAKADLIDQLMNGVVYYRGYRYNISALDLAALKDAGVPIVDQFLFSDGFE